MIRKIGVFMVCCMISGLVAGQALAVCKNYSAARTSALMWPARQHRLWMRTGKPVSALS